jgi:hypothetical protein
MTQPSLFDELIQPALTLARLLWVALTASIPIYVLLAYLVFAEKTRAGQVTSLAEISYYFHISAGSLIVLSIVLRRLLFSRDRLKKRLSVEMCPKQLSIDPQTKQVDLKRLKKVGQLTKNELKLLSLGAWHFGPFFAILAINELVAILGVILAALSRQGEAVLPFAAAGILLNLTLYGKLNRLVEQGRLILGRS